jgi:hypothetical protein
MKMACAWPGARRACRLAREDLPAVERDVEVRPRVNECQDRLGYERSSLTDTDLLIR